MLTELNIKTSPFDRLPPAGGGGTLVPEGDKAALRSNDGEGLFYYQKENAS